MASNQGRRQCHHPMHEGKLRVPTNAFPQGGGRYCRKCIEKSHQARRASNEEIQAAHERRAAEYARAVREEFGC